MYQHPAVPNFTGVSVAAMLTSPPTLYSTAGIRARTVVAARPPDRLALMRACISLAARVSHAEDSRPPSMRRRLDAIIRPGGS